MELRLFKFFSNSEAAASACDSLFGSRSASPLPIRGTESVDPPHQTFRTELKPSALDVLSASRAACCAVHCRVKRVRRVGFHDEGALLQAIRTRALQEKLRLSNFYDALHCYVALSDTGTVAEAPLSARSKSSSLQSSRRLGDSASSLEPQVVGGDYVVLFDTKCVVSASVCASKTNSASPEANRSPSPDSEPHRRPILCWVPEEDVVDAEDPEELKRAASFGPHAAALVTVTRQLQLALRRRVIEMPELVSALLPTGLDDPTHAKLQFTLRLCILQRLLILHDKRLSRHVDHHAAVVNNTAAVPTLMTLCVFFPSDLLYASRRASSPLSSHCSPTSAAHRSVDRSATRGSAAAAAAQSVSPTSSTASSVYSLAAKRFECAIERLQPSHHILVQGATMCSSGSEDSEYAEATESSDGDDGTVIVGASFLGSRARGDLEDSYVVGLASDSSPAGLRDSVSELAGLGALVDPTVYRSESALIQFEGTRRSEIANRAQSAFERWCSEERLKRCCAIERLLLGLEAEELTSRRAVATSEALESLLLLCDQELLSRQSLLHIAWLSFSEIGMLAAFHVAVESCLITAGNEAAAWRVLCLSAVESEEGVQRSMYETSRQVLLDLVDSQLRHLDEEVLFRESIQALEQSQLAEACAQLWVLQCALEHTGTWAWGLCHHPAYTAATWTSADLLPPTILDSVELGGIVLSEMDHRSCIDAASCLHALHLQQLLRVAVHETEERLRLSFAADLLWCSAAEQRARYLLSHVAFSESASLCLAAFAACVPLRHRSLTARVFADARSCLAAIALREADERETASRHCIVQQCAKYIRSTAARIAWREDTQRCLLCVSWALRFTHISTECVLEGSERASALIVASEGREWRCVELAACSDMERIHRTDIAVRERATRGILVLGSAEATSRLRLYQMLYCEWVATAPLHHAALQEHFRREELVRQCVLIRSAVCLSQLTAVEAQHRCGIQAEEEAIALQDIAPTPSGGSLLAASVSSTLRERRRIVFAANGERRRLVSAFLVGFKELLVEDFAEEDAWERWHVLSPAELASRETVLRRETHSEQDAARTTISLLQLQDACFRLRESVEEQEVIERCTLQQHTGVSVKLCNVAALAMLASNHISAHEVTLRRAITAQFLEGCLRAQLETLRLSEQIALFADIHVPCLVELECLSRDEAEHDEAQCRLCFLLEPPCRYHVEFAELRERAQLCLDHHLARCCVRERDCRSAIARERDVAIHSSFVIAELQSFSESSKRMYTRGAAGFLCDIAICEVSERERLLRGVLQDVTSNTLKVLGSRSDVLHCVTRALCVYPNALQREELLERCQWCLDAHATVEADRRHVVEQQEVVERSVVSRCAVELREMEERDVNEQRRWLLVEETMRRAIVRSASCETLELKVVGLQEPLMRAAVAQEQICAALEVALTACQRQEEVARRILLRSKAAHDAVGISVPERESQERLCIAELAAAEFGDLLFKNCCRSEAIARQLIAQRLESRERLFLKVAHREENERLQMAQSDALIRFSMLADRLAQIERHLRQDRVAAEVKARACLKCHRLESCGRLEIMCAARDTVFAAAESELHTRERFTRGSLFASECATRLTIEHILAREAILRIELSQETEPCACNELRAGECVDAEAVLRSVLCHQYHVGKISLTLQFQERRGRLINEDVETSEFVAFACDRIVSEEALLRLQLKAIAQAKWSMVVCVGLERCEREQRAEEAYRVIAVCQSDLCKQSLLPLAVAEEHRSRRQIQQCEHADISTAELRWSEEHARVLLVSRWRDEIVAMVNGCLQEGEAVGRIDVLQNERVCRGLLVVPCKEAADRWRILAGQDDDRAAAVLSHVQQAERLALAHASISEYLQAQRRCSAHFAADVLLPELVAREATQRRAAQAHAQSVLSDARRCCIVSEEATARQLHAAQCSSRWRLLVRECREGFDRLALVHEVHCARKEMAEHWCLQAHNCALEEISCRGVIEKIGEQKKHSALLHAAALRHCAEEEALARSEAVRRWSASWTRCVLWAHDIGWIEQTESSGRRHIRQRAAEARKSLLIADAAELEALRRAHLGHLHRQQFKCMELEFIQQSETVFRCAIAARHMHQRNALATTAAHALDRQLIVDSEMYGRYRYVCVPESQSFHHVQTLFLHSDEGAWRAHWAHVAGRAHCLWALQSRSMRLEHTEEAARVALAAEMQSEVLTLELMRVRDAGVMSCHSTAQEECGEWQLLATAFANRRAHIHVMELEHLLRVRSVTDAARHHVEIFIACTLLQQDLWRRCVAQGAEIELALQYLFGLELLEKDLRHAATNAAEVEHAAFLVSARIAVRCETLVWELEPSARAACQCQYDKQRLHLLHSLARDDAAARQHLLRREIASSEQTAVAHWRFTELASRQQAALDELCRQEGESIQSWSSAESRCRAQAALETSLREELESAQLDLNLVDAGNEALTLELQDRTAAFKAVEAIRDDTSVVLRGVKRATKQLARVSEHLEEFGCASANMDALERAQEAVESSKLTWSTVLTPPVTARLVFSPRDGAEGRSAWELEPAPPTLPDIDAVLVDVTRACYSPRSISVRAAAISERLLRLDIFAQRCHESRQETLLEIRENYANLCRRFRLAFEHEMDCILNRTQTLERWDSYSAYHLRRGTGTSADPRPRDTVSILHSHLSRELEETAASKIHDEVFFVKSELRIAAQAVVELKRMKKSVRSKHEHEFRAMRKEAATSRRVMQQFSEERASVQQEHLALLKRFHAETVKSSKSRQAAQVSSDRRLRSVSSSPQIRSK